MKKKQLFAVLLAGSMTVGMAPAAAFAAEDTGAGAAAAAEAQVTDDNTDNTDATDDSATADAEAQKQAEADAQAAAQAQAEADAQAAAEAEAQKQAEEQAAAEAEAQKQAEEQAAAEAAAKEATEKGTIVTTETELTEAIKAAAAVDTNVTTVAQAKPTRIVVSGTIELTKSVTIPPNKSIALLGKDEEAAIKRADSYKGNLFEISANGALYMAKKDPTEEDPTTGTLTIDGSLSDGSAVTGSLIHIVEGASFSMTTGVTLKNNNSTATGAAVFNEGGKFILIGGTVTGNKGDSGAIYSTGIISVKKGEDATDAEPSVTGNVKSDGETESNIVLAKGGNIQIISKDTDENGEPVKERITDKVKLGFSVESPEEGYAAITNGTNEDIFKAALKVLAKQYEGDQKKFIVEEATGKLVAVSEEPTPTPTTSVEPTATPTPTKKPTATPTLTKASLRWTGSSWRDYSSATITCIIGADGICNYTWKVKDSKEVGGSGKLNIKADKAFDIELNNLPNKEIEVYITAKDSKGNDILLQATIKGVVKTAKSFKVSLPESKRPATPTPKQPTPTDTPNAYIPDVKESILQGLDTAMEFYPNTFYPFKVIGAGTTNTNPSEGDVKWEPLYWSTSANPEDKDKHSTWKIGSTKGISKGSKFSLYVFFQKWVYTGGKWTETDTISSARYEFGSVPITITPSAGAGANGANGSGGQTGSDPDATVTGAASATSANGGNGTTSRNAVSTADNSPIGTMSALAVASILAGGYVIVRRRKKDI